MREKLSGIWKKLVGFLTDPRYEKPILIAAPCVTVLLLALLFLPRLSAGPKVVKDPEPVLAVPPSFSLPPATPAPTAAPTPSPSAQPVRTALKASSTERDLYIAVYGQDGAPITGETFTLTVSYPDGSTKEHDTAGNGGCYLDGLPGGEYTVGMKEHSGYLTAAPIRCTVKEQVEYRQIEDIEDYVDVKDVTEVADEVKTPDPYADPEDAVIPEDLGAAPEGGQTGEDDPYAGGGASDGQVWEDDPYADGGGQSPSGSGSGGLVPVLDSRGYPTYTYTFHTGPNGYLLYRDSQEESNVELIDEDGDGVPDYGMYFFLPQTPEEGTESDLTANGYYVSVELFHEDNSPVEEYYIDAEPILAEEETQRQDPSGWREINGKTYYYDADGQPVKGLKKIDGRLYYFDQYGAKASSVGVDVSFYNENVNWQALKAQGIDFAIVRLGGRTWQSGDLYDDIRTQQYLSGAKNAGIKVGAYFYSTAVNEVEAVQEASLALSILDGTHLDMPLFFDTEYSGIYPQGRADRLSKSERSAIIRAFCETVINSGYAAGVYSGENFMKSNLDYDVISRYTVWLASYTSNNKLPNFSRPYDIWQFTDKAQLEGATGSMDLNVIF